MKIWSLAVMALVVTFPALADVSIEKSRVICDNQGAMVAFMQRKSVKLDRQALPKGCSVSETKRRGEIVQTYPKQGYLELKLKTGKKVFVDKDAINRS
tara:strand:- start:51 stop:344 length:294 start_codon:yes stop_codon:yes gene_type:complete